MKALAEMKRRIGAWPLLLVFLPFLATDQPRSRRSAQDQITRFDRQQVNRLIHELEREEQVEIEGYGRGAKYHYIGSEAG